MKELIPGRAYDIKYAKYVEEILTPAKNSYRPTARLLVQAEEPTDRIYDKLIVEQMIMGEGHRQYIHGQLESILDPSAAPVEPGNQDGEQEDEASATEETVVEEGGDAAE